MTKADHLRSAVLLIEAALIKLQRAKQDLRHAKNSEYLSLSLHFAALEEIHDTLTDPVCTPEFYAEGGDSDDH